MKKGREREWKEMKHKRKVRGEEKGRWVDRGEVKGKGRRGERNEKGEQDKGKEEGVRGRKRER